MKKFLVSLMAFFAMGLCLEAQEKLDTWSVYDVDKDTKVSVQDVTKVVDRAKKANANDPQVVDAAQLNAVLEAISEKLKKLELIESRLAALEAKTCSCACGGSSPDLAYDHEYVDLGLSVKWATCNVGAEKPEDHGEYYAWGETEPKKEYFWDTYFDSVNGSSSNFDKYATNKKTQLDPEDDVAHVKWQGDWRMPTFAEQDELCTQCTWTWDSTKNGYKVTSKKNGNSIFLPAAGFHYYSGPSAFGSGVYWSSSLNPGSSYDAYGLDFDSDYVRWYDGNRFGGLSVRPVCP